MTEPAKLLTDTLLDAIRQVVREELIAMQGAPHSVGDGKPKPRAAREGSLLTPEQAGEVLGLSRSTIRQMIADNQLPAVCLRSGRRKKVWRVRRAALDKWLNGRERQVK